MNQDGDEMQALGVDAVTTDTLENIGVGANGQSVDGDESQTFNTGVQTWDNLDSVGTSLGGTVKDDDSFNKYGIDFSFDDLK